MTTVTRPHRAAGPAAPARRKSSRERPPAVTDSRGNRCRYGRPCEGSEAARQVVEAAARLRPHVVCLDGYMPVMARLAAAQALRAAEPGIRIVLLAGGSGARFEVARAEADALVLMEASRETSSSWTCPCQEWTASRPREHCATLFLSLG